MQDAVYSIIRCHDGVCTLLEDLDTNPDTITIKTDRFSTYAVVYTNNSNTIEAPRTGYQSNMYLICVLGLALLCISFSARKYLNKK